jgi:4-hydroxy-2-oxoheptanedioate aldolase
MNGWEFKQALHEGRRLYGTMFVTARTGRWDQTIGAVGMDFVIVDNEHAPYSRSETADWVHKLTEMGVVPFIRVPTARFDYVTMASDAGAQGILVPYVETVAQVREVVGASKFRPLKGEAVKRAVDEGHFPSKATKSHLEEFNRNNVLVIGIESVVAVERLEKLISVPGVDGAFVGPNDLSIQLGIPNQYDHPKFVETLTHIHDVCRAKKVPLVIHLFNHDMAAFWIRRGVHFILFGTDRRALSEGFHADFEYLRGVNGAKHAVKAASKAAAKGKPKLRLVKSNGGKEHHRKVAAKLPYG